MTQLKLAEKAGVPIDVVRRIERGDDVASGSLMLVMDALGLVLSTHDAAMKLALVREILEQ